MRLLHLILFFLICLQVCSELEDGADIAVRETPTKTALYDALNEGYDARVPPPETPTLRVQLALRDVISVSY